MSGRIANISEAAVAAFPTLWLFTCLPLWRCPPPAALPVRPPPVGSPVHHRLGSQHTRFQPWFPFVQKAVAELAPPDAKGTHWNFTAMLPQLLDFINATAGRAVNLNVATHPCWLFTNWLGLKLNCTPPASPDTLDFAYGTTGKRTHLADKSGQTLADYFGRVFAYLTTGQFVDELGVTHTGARAPTLRVHASPPAPTRAALVHS